jgi:hypothetical protein
MVIANRVFVRSGDKYCIRRGEGIVEALNIGNSDFESQLTTPGGSVKSFV